MREASTDIACWCKKMDKIGFVICSRTDSKRLPGKPFLKVGGKYVIAHLIDRLRSCGMPVYIAVPKAELTIYEINLQKYLSETKGVYLFAGDRDDPLKRMLKCAERFDLDHVIRVTHDKVFINYMQVDCFVSHYKQEKLDYLYSTNFIPGTGFEIFSRKVLSRAADRFEKVEHISYAVEEVTRKKQDLYHFPLNRAWLLRKYGHSSLRLLIDYPEDLDLIDSIFDRLGNECDIRDVADLLGKSRQVNHMPDVSIYTCCYNDWQYLERAGNSVMGQSHPNFEYLMINDASKRPEVLDIMSAFNFNFRNAFVRSNRDNIGLASSSNKAIEFARGRYVIRLDADDFFVDDKIIERMARYMEESGCDALYPAYIQDGQVIPGHVKHHVGGTMFKKRALDLLRFTDGLRHYEGLDLYNRAIKHGLKIHYFPEPAFYYRQRAKSMSKNKSAARQEIKVKLDQGLTGSDLL